ncbi:DUF6371 domain-containing protein [Polaribacter sp. Z014]|uniref:DUF6371 domain-containing protein n=1 Tax=Polaribacter sp. Z014 TaxID=2927126 RepID=UPI002020CDDD|nr:DUF6371 domain-containing protein [Polaribacter sp. Z014]MCL7762680.1 DUF6371 domain-containing protein [Polaribacter sp. Z014]
MYKYSLHKKSIKHKCPQCKKNRFVLYVDNETGDYLSPEVGRCDREINCGYHLTPKTYFKNENKPFNPYTNYNTQEKSRVTNYHSESELNSSLNNYDKNNFVQFLYSKFDSIKVTNLLNEYKIGTSESWYDGTIFWQIDTQQKIRSGKIILYDKIGKRTKYINWIHSLNIKSNRIDSFNLNQCLFGEHLIPKYDKPIAIVESEKTACIMNIMFEKYLWLATGSLQGLNTKKIKVLKNRTIILYPDLGIEGKNGSPFTKWKTISEELRSNGYDIKTSDLLEKKGTKNEREKGFDIADYFIKNLTKKPSKIISTTNQKILKMYMKNKNIKTLIEVFDLTNLNGKAIIF